MAVAITQFLVIPPSRIVKPYVYIVEINSQTFLNMKCQRLNRAESGLFITGSTFYL